MVDSIRGWRVAVWCGTSPTHTNASLFMESDFEMLHVLLLSRTLPCHQYEKFVLDEVCPLGKSQQTWLEAFVTWGWYFLMLLSVAKLHLFAKAWAYQWCAPPCNVGHKVLWVAVLVVQFGRARCCFIHQDVVRGTFPIGWLMVNFLCCDCNRLHLGRNWDLITDVSRQPLRVTLLCLKGHNT